MAPYIVIVYSTVHTPLIYNVYYIPRVHYYTYYRVSEIRRLPNERYLRCETPTPPFCTYIVRLYTTATCP